MNGSHFSDEELRIIMETGEQLPGDFVGDDLPGEIMVNPVFVGNRIIDDMEE